MAARRFSSVTTGNVEPLLRTRPRTLPRVSFAALHNDISHQPLFSSPIVQNRHDGWRDRQSQVVIGAIPQPRYARPGKSLDDILQTIKDDLAHVRKVTALKNAFHYLASISSSSTGPTNQSYIKAHYNLLKLCLDSPHGGVVLAKILAKINHDSDVITPGFILELCHAAIKYPGRLVRALSTVINLPHTPKDAPLFPGIVPRIVHGLIDHPHIDISDIKNFLLEEAATDQTSARGWPLYVWSIVIRQLEYRPAVEFLGEFKSHVESVRASRNDDWTVHEIRNITDPYIHVVRAWSKSRFSGQGAPPPRVASLVPRTLAKDLLQLIGSQHLPVDFINAWMNAERIAQNYQAARKVWNLLDTRPLPLLIYHPPDLSTTKYRPHPDAYSWAVYFKLLKSTSPDLPAQNIRQEIRTMLEILPIASLSTYTLNSILSCLSSLSSSPDLPLLLLVLRLYDWDVDRHLGPPPIERTIDLVAAALVQIWRETGPILDRLFISSMARAVREETADFSRSKAGIFKKEWEMVSMALAELVPEEDQLDNMMDPHTILPLGQSTMTRLSRKGGSDLSNGGALTMRNPTPYKFGLTQSHPDESLVDTDEYGDVSNCDNPRYPTGDFDPPPAEHTMAHTLLRPTIALVERAIRLHIAARVDSDRRLEEAFDQVLQNVYDEVVPKSVVAWSKNGEDAEWEAVRK